jgi:hypothetical protein
MFQIFWNQIFGPTATLLAFQKSCNVPKILESVFCVTSEISRAFQKFWNFHFLSQKDRVEVPEALEAVFGIHQTSCVPINTPPLLVP